MGTSREAALVQPLAGLLAASVELLGAALDALRETFGPATASTVPAPWTVSSYYAAEMGEALWRQFAAFEAPVSPGSLWRLKLRTNELEGRWKSGAGRRVNIDPGYLDLSKVVLASTKDAAHRIYLNGGIYAEATLHFANGSFHPHAYTYPDYAAPDAVQFFNDVRARWKAASKKGAGAV